MFECFNNFYEKNDEPKKISSVTKWFIAFLAAILFFVVANPNLYNFTHEIFSKLYVNIIDSSGAVTLFGVLIHTFVFLGIVRLLL